jgi:hypothetical protein
VKIAEESTHANNVSESIKSSMHSLPYRQVESDWEDVKKRTYTTLDTLTDILIAIDDDPNDKRKQLATNLVVAYQSSLRNLADATRLAVYLERTENAVSMISGLSVNLSSGYLNYSIPRAPAQVNIRNIARSGLDAQVNEKEDALRSLKLPELLYGNICHIAFSPLPYVKQSR